MFSGNTVIISGDGAAYGLLPRGADLRALAEIDVRKLFLSLRLLKELLSRISYVRWFPYISLDFETLLSISIECLNQDLPGKIVNGKPDLNKLQ